MQEGILHIYKDISILANIYEKINYLFARMFEELPVTFFIFCYKIWNIQCKLLSTWREFFYYIFQKYI